MRQAEGDRTVLDTNPTGGPPLQNLKKKPFVGVVAAVSALTATVLLSMTSEVSGQELPASVTTDAGTIRADKVAPLFKRPGYSPHAGRNYPARVLWGEMNLHTSFSGDAAAGTRIGPEDALRFLSGAEITSNTGQPVKLARPLDCVAISDHSDALGVVPELIADNPKLMADPTARRWSMMMNAGGEDAMRAVMEIITAQGEGKVPPVIADPQLSFDIWKKLTAIVEKYNDPGRFTTLHAYEWTSNYGGGNNLRRNVVYRDGKEKADRIELWKWMQDYEAKTGGEVLAIPHNGNVSNGLMFALTTFNGNAPTKSWAETRARYEPLYEITQRKGTSGPRISVRFFGGFDFLADDALSREPGAVGYKKGAPMGAELQRAPGGKRPTFLVAAMKDPLSGNPDRIQIVKGWLDAAGKTHEKIYDVAWGDGEKRRAGGDLKTATGRNTIGDPELAAVWVDPDPKLRAFYHARVIETPTPRWTRYDAGRFSVKMSGEMPMTVQERAYTSPIWYRPG